MKQFRNTILLAVYFICWGFMWQSCHKDTTETESIAQAAHYQTLQECEECRSGAAPLLDTSTMIVDSTIVTERQTQIIINGYKLDSLFGTLSGGQGVSYNGKIYNHYKSATLKFKDGTIRTYSPIYITHKNVNIAKGGTWPSMLRSTHTANVQRWERTTLRVPYYLPLRGEEFYKYAFVVYNDDKFVLRDYIPPNKVNQRIFKF